MEKIESITPDVATRIIKALWELRNVISYDTKGGSGAVFFYINVPNIDEQVILTRDMFPAIKSLQYHIHIGAVRIPINSEDQKLVEEFYKVIVERQSGNRQERVSLCVRELEGMVKMIKGGQETDAMFRRADELSEKSKNNQ